MADRKIPYIKLIYQNLCAVAGSGYGVQSSVNAAALTLLGLSRLLGSYWVTGSLGSGPLGFTDRSHSPAAEFNNFWATGTVILVRISIRGRGKSSRIELSVQAFTISGHIRDRSPSEPELLLFKRSSRDLRAGQGCDESSRRYEPLFFPNTGTTERTSAFWARWRR
jgi:hypothetical protein